MADSVNPDQTAPSGAVGSGFTLFDQDCYMHDQIFRVGAQWLSGRVLDSRPKGHRFEPHRRHCVVVLEQDTYILA